MRLGGGTGLVLLAVLIVLTYVGGMVIGEFLLMGDHAWQQLLGIPALVALLVGSAKAGMFLGEKFFQQEER